MIWLDTNVVIAALNNRPPQVRARLTEALAAGEQLAISAIVLFEMAYGYEKSANRTRNEVALAAFLTLGMDQMDFTPADAAVAGALRAELERRGTPIGGFDVLIAAHARRHDGTLVTANTREFARVADLRVIDWADEGKEEVLF